MNIGANAAIAGKSIKNLGEAISGRWGDANNVSKGFLNPTAAGAGAGMLAGGAYGGLSSDGSFLGGAAGGAFLGAGMGAGGYAGYNKVAHRATWDSLKNSASYGDIARRKTSQFTNPAFSSPLFTQ